MNATTDTQRRPFSGLRMVGKITARAACDLFPILVMGVIGAAFAYFRYWDSDPIKFGESMCSVVPVVAVVGAFIGFFPRDKTHDDLRRTRFYAALWSTAALVLAIVHLDLCDRFEFDDRQLSRKAFGLGVVLFFLLGPQIELVGFKRCTISLLWGLLGAALLSVLLAAVLQCPSIVAMSVAIRCRAPARGLTR